nr:xylulose kinase-1 [Tanacetum cinerariifolium]
MAVLRYKDEHNKVGYLLKPTGSDDYHQIINFLRASHIRYALTHNPIIFDSLVKQFWSIAMLRSPELGPPAIQANIDKTPYTITEDLVRSQLQLADDAGIDDLPIVEIYSGMDNLGIHFEGHPMPNLPVMLLQAQAGEEDEPLEGSFHMSPLRSTQDPPSGQPSGGAKDPITLTSLSFIVSTFVQKVNSLETELKNHMKLFKDVVRKLVKKVKAMEVKLKTKKMKMVVTVTVDSNIPPGCASYIPAASTSVPAAVPTSALTIPAGSPSVPADVPPSVAPAGVSSKGKSPMAAKRLHDEEQAQLDRQRAELQRRRQQEVLDSAMYYTEEDWIHIRAQVEANASLFKILLGDDVSKDNFPARMAALIKRKKQSIAEKLAKERRNRPMTQAQQRTYMRQFVNNQSRAVYSTGWSMARVKSFIDAQLKEEFEKIQKAILNIQIQAFSQTLKRTGPMLEEPFSKRQNSTEAPIPFVHDVPQSPVVSSPPSSGTRRKSLGRKRLPKPKPTLQELDLDADAQTFIKIVSIEDSDDAVPPVWSAFVGWEVIHTPLGDINALYRMDRSTSYFTTLREILHMVDRHDLLNLYGLVVKYYENHREIRSWRLNTLSNVHILETVSSEVLYMFADVSYPLSVKLMERMLTHKLEIDTDVVRNDMTTAEQLIQFIKNQLAAA